MGVCQSSNSTSSSPCYTINIYDDSQRYEMAKVYVKSRRIDAFFGVHHYIVCDIPTFDKWIVLEWSTCGKSFYTCKSLRNSHTCIYLGSFKVKDVYEAAQSASSGHSYSDEYNCNHWTENVAYKLGRDITVHWNCSCVLN